MKWLKKGKIFQPGLSIPEFNCNEFAQSPQALIFGDFIRVYFSTRIRDTENQYLSKIVYVDYDLQFNNIINYSKTEVIPLGQLGSFDEHGIFPFSPLRIKDRILAYTCGWSRRVSVPVETSTGLAYSEDGGNTFKKSGVGPIFTSAVNEPFLVGDSFVIYEDDIYHMWYMYGKKWIIDTESQNPERVYKIGYATSLDGMQWTRSNSAGLIPDALDENECQALPTVIKIDNVYHMYFCFRHATDFRINHKRSYRLGYAYSIDLENWIRNDELGGISVSETGWDSEMMCYPNLCKVAEKYYLLYNGNAFGKYGFGVAELIQM